jgi:uncharacterized protein YndB with AHSA1/START domain
MNRRASLCVLVAALAGAGRVLAADSLALEGTIEAPVAAVWSALTTSDGLQSWMAPHAEIELRINGLMRANYRAEGALGDPSTIVNQVLSFEPQRMLSTRVAQPPEGFPFPHAIANMWTVIYFEPLAAARTRLRVVSLGFGEDDESQRMRAFFERGNAATLQKLQEKFRP